MTKQLWAVALLAGILCLSGCAPKEDAATSSAPDAGGDAASEETLQPPPPPSPAPEGQTEDPSLPAPESGAALRSVNPGSDVQLTIQDWDSTLAMVQQLRGNVVVMDLWATYCPPCVAEFPNLVTLQRSYPGDVDCVSVSVDYNSSRESSADRHAEKVLAFLQKQGATFKNVLLSTDAETLFNEKIAQNSLPVVYVFDRDGRLAGQFPDPQDPDEFNYQEHVVPLVKKLLSEK